MPPPGDHAFLLTILRRLLCNLPLCEANHDHIEAAQEYIITYLGHSYLQVVSNYRGFDSNELIWGLAFQPYQSIAAQCSLYMFAHLHKVSGRASMLL